MQWEALRGLGQGTTWSHFHLPRFTLPSMLRTGSRCSRHPEILACTKVFSRYTVHCCASRSLHLPICRSRMPFLLLLQHSDSLFGVTLPYSLPGIPSPFPPGRVSSLPSPTSCHEQTPWSLLLGPSPGWTRRSSSVRTAAFSSVSRDPAPSQPRMGAWQMLSEWRELLKHPHHWQKH